MLFAQDVKESTETSNSTRVALEKEKPESFNSGVSVTRNVIATNHTLAIPPITGKCNEFLIAESLVSKPIFIKLNRCQMTEELLTQYPMAFLILSYIAYRAKRTTGKSLKGMAIGQMVMGRDDLKGTYRNPGPTSQNVRSALKYLKCNQLIDYHATSKGTVVTLLDSDIWDINQETCNQVDRSYVTTIQPASNQHVTTNKEDKKERKKEEDKKNKKTCSVRNDPEDRLRSRPQSTISFSFENRVWENIDQKDLDGWALAYPALNIQSELRKMGEWFLANPTKRRKNYRRFINAWLTRSQDRSSDSPLFQAKPMNDLDPLLKRVSTMYEYQLKFGNVEIYSSSGNKVFECQKSETKRLEKWLVAKYL